MQEKKIKLALAYDSLSEIVACLDILPISAGFIFLLLAKCREDVLTSLCWYSLAALVGAVAYLLHRSSRRLWEEADSFGKSRVITAEEICIIMRSKKRKLPRGRGSLIKRRSAARADRIEPIYSISHSIQNVKGEF